MEVLSLVFWSPRVIRLSFVVDRALVDVHNYRRLLQSLPKPNRKQISASSYLEEVNVIWPRAYSPIRPPEAIPQYCCLHIHLSFLSIALFFSIIFLHSNSFSSNRFLLSDSISLYFLFIDLVKGNETFPCQL